MVMPNLYGNIVNNVCAGLVGGPGLVAGANYGHVYAVFETVSVARAAGLSVLESSHLIQFAESIGYGVAIATVSSQNVVVPPVLGAPGGLSRLSN